MFTRIVDAGGGLDAFLDDHAVLLTADHAQTAVEHALPLADELAEDWAVLQPNTDRPEEAEIAVSPTSRAGAVYILDTGRRHRGHTSAPACACGSWPGSIWSPGSPGRTARPSCAPAWGSTIPIGSRPWSSGTATSSASGPGASCGTCAATTGR